MSRRSRDWNESLAQELRDREFAREFVLGLLDEGFTLQQALAKVIRAYGIKEFASKARIPGPNILRSIDGRHNPPQKTLEHLLRPLGLRLAVAPARPRRSVA
jgi:DNA-binding phage protein